MRVSLRQSKTFSGSGAEIRFSATARLADASGPRKARTLTAQGHPRAIFQRAVERGNLLLAETTAREMGKISVGEALELVALIARHDPPRHGRAGARWMRLYLELNHAAGLDDVVFVAGCLCALGGADHDPALASLRAVSRTASSRGRLRGVG